MFGKIRDNLGTHLKNASDLLPILILEFARIATDGQLSTGAYIFMGPHIANRYYIRKK